MPVKLTGILSFKKNNNPPPPGIGNQALTPRQNALKKHIQRCEYLAKTACIIDRFLLTLFSYIGNRTL